MWQHVCYHYNILIVYWCCWSSQSLYYRYRKFMGQALKLLQIQWSQEFSSTYVWLMLFLCTQIGVISFYYDEILCRYNSGTREFHQIPSTRISKAVDAFTLHHYIWELAKSKKQNLWFVFIQFLYRIINVHIAK